MNIDSNQLLNDGDYQLMSSFASDFNAHNNVEMQQNIQKFNLDISDKSYDSDGLITMILQEQIFNETSQTFSQISCVLKVNLATFKYIEAVVLNNQDLDKQAILFLFQCSHNMAVKVQSALVYSENMEKYIDRQLNRSKEFWDMKILWVENCILESLNWNSNVITASNFLNFFLDNHFQDIVLSQIDEQSNQDATSYQFDEQACSDIILLCFCENKWSSISIAIACLAYCLSSEKKHLNYLYYLVEMYRIKLSKFDTSFDIFQINEIVNFIEQYFESDQEIASPEQQNEESNNNNTNEEEIKEDYEENTQSNLIESYAGNFTPKQSQDQQQQKQQQDIILTQKLNPSNEDIDGEKSMEAEAEDDDDEEEGQNCPTICNNDQNDSESYEYQSRKISVSSFCFENRDSIQNKKRSSTEYQQSHKRTTIQLDRNSSVNSADITTTNSENRSTSKSVNFTSSMYLSSVPSTSVSITQYENDDEEEEDCLQFNEQIYEKGFLKKLKTNSNSESKQSMIQIFQ